MNTHSICKRMAALGGWVALAAGLSACTMFDEDNRRVLNWMDTQIQPQSVAARVALAPVMVPVGTAALAVDYAVVNPIAVVPDAWDDTYELYWRPRQIDWLRKSLYFPFCVALTPPTFAGDWLVRGYLDSDL